MHFLVLDDDITLIEYYELILKSMDYSGDYFLDPLEALKTLQQSSIEYDFILSDVQMPHMDGYEFSNAVKAIPTCKSVPFIFISKLTTDEDKIKGLNCDVDDYIEKPLSAEILKIKIAQIAARREQKRILESNVKENQSSMFSLMQSYGDVGKILDFYKDTASADTIELLILSLFHTTDQLGLDAYLGMFIDQKPGFFSTMADISTLEAEIIEAVRKKSRFYTARNKLFINYKDFTLFIRNIPEDEMRAGALRDTLGLLCNAFEAQLDEVLLKLKMQENEATSIKAQNMLIDVQSVQKTLEDNTLNSMNKLRNQMIAEFPGMGLTEYQEELIMQLIDACDLSIQHSVDLGQQLLDKLSDASETLNSMRVKE